ncbi:NUDIX hydrolase [Actinomyces sp. B33]|uniref:NUDIX domain-containing protein n=1 Tax=Actinomyces sp. B33 TaxID=2942131 RepID=UPI00233F805B|nr:NUDIX hydrolase [Actinomyces sp. B33]MDC4233391.1 NUDIX hydrolase [Actinomyces sp. B33]
MTGPAPTAGSADRKSSREVVSHERVWSGRIVGIEVDDVRVVDGAAPVTREYARHPGAVAIVALRGPEGREEILLERQYRHPVGCELWEIPAGLLDVDGEDPLVAAQRELAEEADLRAGRWDVLIDLFSSPGISTESLRVFLARDLSPTGTVFDREDEEAGIETAWVDLDEAVRLVLAGGLHAASAVSGVLAAHACRMRGWQPLRPVRAPWLR